MRYRVVAAVDHPVLGEIKRYVSYGILEDCWSLTVSLPAFRICYERWGDDGREFPDRRDEDARAGRFPLRIPFTPADGPGRHEPPLPSDAQVATVEYLKATQDRLVAVVAAALVEQAPKRFHWEDVSRHLSDVMLERLATPAGMLQAVELEGFCLGVRERDGLVQVGLAFHSGILETEHGVSVILHRDVPVLVGAWDCLDQIDSTQDDWDRLMGASGPDG